MEKCHRFTAHREGDDSCDEGGGGGGEKTIYNTHKTVTTSLSTGGGPVSYVQLSEGGFQVVYPLGLWSRLSGVVKVLYGYG